LALPEYTVVQASRFVREVQPGADLRIGWGMDVHVGNRVTPPWGDLREARSRSFNLRCLECSVHDHPSRTSPARPRPRGRHHQPRREISWVKPAISAVAPGARHAMGPVKARHLNSRGRQSSAWVGAWGSSRPRLGPCLAPAQASGASLNGSPKSRIWHSRLRLAPPERQGRSGPPQRRALGGGDGGGQMKTAILLTEPSSPGPIRRPEDDSLPRRRSIRNSAAAGYCGFWATAPR
jgi:hypothetical protein